TFLSALFLELEFAIYIGTFLSIGLYLKKTAKPAVHAMVPEPESRKFIISNKKLVQCPQLGVTAIEGDMYFAATFYVEEQISRLRTICQCQNKLIVAASNINHIDSAGCESFKNIINEYRRNGGDIYFAGFKPEVFKLLLVSGVIDYIGLDHIFDHKKDALKSIIPYLDMRKCANCQLCVFSECDINRSIGLKIFNEREALANSKRSHAGRCMPVYENVQEGS
ncbi:MAG: STAS domain-containing protein, partial [Candidatus Magnetominusculus sp. LBB02]|nr:STAS domain-containing protein [Candidatus Magnetominusculus sp. LBB02]